MWSDLSKDDGLNIFLHKLEELYKTEQTQDSYYTYTKFNNFSQSEEMDINKYILEFEHLNNKMLKFELKLADKLLFLKLLDGASLNTNKSKWYLHLLAI